MVSFHTKPDFTYLYFNVTLLYKDNIITLFDIFFLKPNYTKNTTTTNTEDNTLYTKIDLRLYKYLMRWGLWTFENGVDRTVDELKTANIYIVCCQDVLQSVERQIFPTKCLTRI